MRIRSIFSLSCVLVFICQACQVRIEVEQVDATIDSSTQAERLTVKASFADRDDTKTAVQSDGTSIYWTPGDAINLFYGTASAGQFTTSIIEPALSTEFSGTLSVATGTSTESGVTTQSFWGVYPYNAGNTCTGDGVTMTIPSSQSGTAGTFADRLNPSVATSPGLSLAFYNVGSWFIFSVMDDDIVSATLTGHNNENLAGRVSVTMNRVTNKPVAEVLEGQKSITMTPEGGTFEAGEQYYMVVIPNRMSSGLQLTLTKSNGKQATWSISNDVTFTRSQYLRKLNADNGLTWEWVGNISFADNAVKTICVSNWDTNDDGELSYDEAAAVTDLGTIFRYNTSIQSFNELVCFEGLTSIRPTAFNNCTALQEITLPQTISSIGNRAFMGCAALTSVTHQGSGISIGNGAFSRCTNLEDFSFDGISQLGDEAFAYCTSLDAVITIPSSVVRIEKTPFKGCTQITRFEGPNTDASGQMLYYIQDGVKCVGQILPSIVNFTMPAGTYFLNCPLGETSARTISIPSTAIIGYGCTIEIPQNVESLTFGNGFSFSSCSIAALPVGCEIYSEYASADHACLIVNNQLIAFSYPQGYWDNHQCYKLPGSISFVASIDLQSNSDQSMYCWGLVFPSTVTFPEYSNYYRINGSGISYIFESSASATSVMNYNQRIDGADCRFIIPRAYYSGAIGGYTNDSAGVMVCPFSGSLPNSGNQMQWWPVFDPYSSQITDGYYVVI